VLEGERSCGIEQPGFEDETVQEASVEISRRLGGMGISGGCSCGEAVRLIVRVVMV